MLMCLDHVSRIMCLDHVSRSCVQDHVSRIMCLGSRVQDHVSRIMCLDHESRSCVQITCLDHVSRLWVQITCLDHDVSRSCVQLLKNIVLIPDADIDECETGSSDCEHVCINGPGRYSCECYFGYRLNDDRKTCTKGMSSNHFRFHVINMIHFWVLKFLQDCEAIFSSI